MYPVTYLALGDSYTIGEGLPVVQSFPYQTVQLLRAAGLSAPAPEIIARTGWTTAELLEAMAQYKFLPAYDFVTLLIGVNNQYRGMAFGTYTSELAVLMDRAIAFAGGAVKRVTLVSIPDYGITPFAREREPEKITREIDEYNRAAREMALQRGMRFQDITPESRVACATTAGLAADDLHPSAAVYASWAAPLSRWMQAERAEK